MTLQENLWKQEVEHKVKSRGTIRSPEMLSDTRNRSIRPTDGIPSSKQSFPHGQKVELSCRYVISVDGISPSPYFNLPRKK